MLHHIQVVGKNVGVKGAEDFAATGEVKGPEGHGYFDIAGRVNTTSFSRSDWGGRMKATLSDCPVLAVRLLASRIGWKIPLSRGTVNLHIEANGRVRNGHMSGSVELSRATVLPAGIFRGRVPINKAAARFSADRHEDSVSIHLAQLLLPGMNLSVEARADKLFTDRATLTVTVKKAVLDLAGLFPLIPIKLLKAEDRERLLGAGLKGRILITGATWRGKLSRVLTEGTWPGTLVINAFLEKVSAFLPGLGLPIQNASGRVRLSSDEMLFDTINLTLGKSPLRLHGFVTDLKSDPRIELFVSTKALAQDLVPLLHNRAIARQLPSWLSQIREPQGGISVELDLDGRLRSPKMKGQVVLDKFQCRLEGFPVALRGLSGALKFEKDGFAVRGLEGHIGETPARVQGSVSPERMAIRAEAKVASGDLKKLSLLPAGWSWSGKVPVTLKVEGTPSRPDFSFRADLRKSRVRMGYLVKKKAGVPLAIEASGSRESGEIKIEDSYLIAGKNRIAAKGSIDRQGKVSLVVSLPPKGIRTENLIPLAHPSLEIQPGGRIEGDGVIKAGPDWSRQMSVDADLALHHVSLQLLGFHKPLSGLTGTIRLRNGVFYAILERAKIGSSFFSGNISIAGWRKTEVRVALTSSFLDTADFAAPPGHVSHVTWGEWIRRNATIRFLARSHGSATLEVAKGNAWGRSFTHFVTKVEGKGGLVSLPSWKINIADGVVRGNALFDIRANTTRPLAIDFQADHLRMQQMLLTDPERVKIEGDVLMSGHLEWNTTSKRENNGLYKTGAIEVRVRDGTIHRFDILSKIFSLINLGSLVRGRLPDVIAQGLPFNRLTWNMEVFGNKWKVKKLVLLSDAAQIDATGMYFSEQGRVDFKVDVSPLVGFDKIVSGLFGNLITRNGKILTTTFRIRGLYRS
ncbi:MAG: DUF3971 domain-containing protein, partial [Deltaproteobacteria bacterium]